MKLLRFVVALAWGLLSTSLTAATLYKSIAPDGKVTYSDQLPHDEKTVKTLTVRTPPPGTAQTNAVTPTPDTGKSQQPDATPAPMNLVLFSATWCGYCRQAQAYLKQRGIAYQEHDIDTPSGRKAFAQSSTQRGIPLLIRNGSQKIRGFSKSSYDAFLSKQP